MADKKRKSKAREKKSTPAAKKQNKSLGKSLLKRKKSSPEIKHAVSTAKDKKKMSRVKSLQIEAKTGKPKAKEVEPEKEFVLPKRKMPIADLRGFKQLLQKLRDRIVDDITFLAGDNLNRSQRESSGDLSSYSFHMADQGTDNFDREFALNLVSSEQDALYEIDEALHKIDAGTYGVCETCAEPIEKARLEALPFAKMCVACKSQSEKGKTRFRPFGPTISQTTESAG